MKHPERVEDYLEHIAQAIERATGYVQHLDSLEALEQNQQAQENKDPDFAAKHAELPWAEMRGMRNKMIHNYFDVDWKIVWRTVKDDLPRLKQQIDGLLIEQRRSKQEQERDQDPSG